MISFVAFWVLARPQQASEFDKLFPHPSGNNALEDYIQAADVLATGHFSTYQRWLPPEKRSTPDQLRQQAEDDKKATANLDPNGRKLVAAPEPGQAPEETRLNEQVNRLSFIQVKEEEVQRFSDALELMTNGNRKPISFAALNGDPADEFPILASLRQLPRLASDAAFVSFAHGQPDRAVSILNEALVLAHRIGAGSLIAELAGIGSSGILLSRFNEQMSALSLAETKSIAALSNQLLGDTDTLKQMAVNEAAGGEKRIAATFDTAQPPEAAAGDKSTLSPAQMADLRQRIARTLEAAGVRAARLFAGPEDGWLAAAETEGQNTGALDSSTNGQIAAYLAQFGNVASDHAAVLAILRSRTQLRLLRLHALVREYRWENGSFPESLEVLKLPRADTYDPLSKKKFEYEVKDGAYRLYSPGIPESGPIELKYRRPAGAGANGPVPL